LADSRSEATDYHNYGFLLQRYGRHLEQIGIFLESNSKNIVNSSSKSNYIKQLISLEKETDVVIAKMSTIKVPEEVLNYHTLNKQALERYHDMLKLLLKSSAASGEEPRKKFLDKATVEAIEGRKLSSEAEIIKPDINQLLQRYILEKD